MIFTVQFQFKTCDIYFISRILTGWAAPQEGQSPEEIPNNLQAAEYRYVPLPQCIAAHGNDEEGRPLVNENHICAIDVAENGNTACNVSIHWNFPLNCDFRSFIYWFFCDISPSIRVILVAQLLSLYQLVPLFKDLLHGTLAVDQTHHQVFSHESPVTLAGFGNKSETKTNNPNTICFIKMK